MTRRDVEALFPHNIAAVVGLIWKKFTVQGLAEAQDAKMRTVEVLLLRNIVDTVDLTLIEFTALGHIKKDPRAKMKNVGVHSL